MEKQFSPSARIFLFLLVIAGWFALTSQLYLIIANRQTSLAEVIIRYFTFFTILTNIIVAVCCTVLLWKPASGWGRFFSKTTTQTAITVNIIIVGVVYNTILRAMWKPEGMQRMVDELLHLVVPLLFVIYWLLCVPKGRLQWRNIFLWAIYPIAYLVIVLIRGAFSGYYPYPFLDVTKLGYPQTLLNSAFIAIAFFIVALIFVGIDKLIGKSNQPMRA
jgi:hypothetical protein